MLISAGYVADFRDTKNRNSSVNPKTLQYVV